MRRLLVSILLLAFSALPGPGAADQPQSLRFGYQKDGLPLIVKQQGLLAARLARAGISVSWVEFQSGPPMLEALNAGSIDVGWVGDTPPIIAQAAGASLVYVAAIPDPGRRSGILVHADSGIRTLADLKGKRVAFARGSSAHHVVVAALAAAGLAYGDIQAIDLQPADAAAAFRNGSVDAWAIWDPFFALGERFPNTRVLTTAEHIAPSNRFLVASGDFATRYPTVVGAVVEEVAEASHWAVAHPQQLAQVFATTTGVELDVEKIVAARDAYAVRYVDATALREQQGIADDFFRLGLIPRPVDVRAIVWTPPPGIRTALR